MSRGGRSERLGDDGTTDGGPPHGRAPHGHVPPQGTPPRPGPPSRHAPSQRDPSQRDPSRRDSSQRDLPQRDLPQHDPSWSTETGSPTDAGVPPQRVRGDGGPSADPAAPAERSRADADRPPSDSTLLQRMRAGDDSAYEELYRRHAGAVRRYARTCCRDADTADDLTAEVFARMLQAVRGGAGPEHAVRAYLLTTVRRVAAAWTRSARREQLVEDFAVFAAQAAVQGGAEAADDTLELGADVRALHEAEQSMAVRAFRSLPERWQAVLWHTEVEDESPSEVATLFGLDANGTRVLASRAREGLRQAYLQAHVSTALTEDEECARHADRLGAYARGGLRTRAERGLRKHLEQCARCRLAAVQIAEVAGGIPAVVPVAVIGWFGAAGYAKAAALLTGGAGAAGAGAAGAASAAGGTGAATGGGPGGAGAGAGGGPGAGSGGGAASEGLGAPVKAGVAAGVVAVAAAVVALALVGDDSPARGPAAEAPPSAPAVGPRRPGPAPPSGRAEPEPPVPASAGPGASAPSAEPPPARTPAPERPAPEPTPPASPSPSPTPSAPSPSPSTAPPPSEEPVPEDYPWNELRYDLLGDGRAPEMRLRGSGWVWQRYGVSIGGERYAGGVTVRGGSSVTVDLNRPCSSYDALAGVDDLAAGPGRVAFSVSADGVRLWRSPPLRGGDPAVPVHVDLTGRETVRLTVEPRTPFAPVTLADWAESRFRCR
ncbi:hypothetical protein GCM10010358_78360 [Streptomyces minutiscleroticus]|uniref:Glycosyl hydrolase family 98 putative carbohydrate-binding module domain-containing protein n=1 Tax=Streptomyces minutiscleroticus TaxID=68238 RepID=A0A918P2F6_9ACTN|nr:sigma-70 family RNA polymerase sigma factor [Streptomyces minutiscleroticus]GGY14577.1 hypothetical protein GCM10010358_78360 [Streptomyces minutiscleroticus]